jgi:hypothetical protein
MVLYLQLHQLLNALRHLLQRLLNSLELGVAVGTVLVSTGAHYVQDRIGGLLVLVGDEGLDL